VVIGSPEGPPLSRHRSAHGRRALPYPLLSAVAAVAGSGGAHRSSTSSLPSKLVATAVAGSAVAAVGQQLLVHAAPVAADGVTALRTTVGDWFGPAAAPVATTPTPVAAAVALPEPSVVRADTLVKAADMQAAAAAKAADDARVAEQARAAEQAKAADEAKKAQDAANARKAPAAAPAAPKPVAKAPAKTAPKPAAAAAPAAANAVGAHAAEVVAGRLSSGFGQRGGEFHQGQDIAAPIGTPIHAPLAGTVIDAGPASGFGLWVRIRHADGTITTYGHVNKFFVKVGQKVAAGEVIAEVGNRGRSTGPHLHFEVTTPAGRKINPLPWLNGLGIRP
jgi:murein DD-endopeptidase MepM/ murein hydrolase activator NlpD